MCFDWLGLFDITGGVLYVVSHSLVNWKRSNNGNQRRQVAQAETRGLRILRGGWGMVFALHSQASAQQWLAMLGMKYRWASLGLEVGPLLACHSLDMQGRVFAVVCVTTLLRYTAVKVFKLQSSAVVSCFSVIV